MQARLHQGAARFVWIVNPTRTAQNGRLAIDGTVPSGGRILWPDSGGAIAAGTYSVPPRDALIVEL